MKCVLSLSAVLVSLAGLAHAQNDTLPVNFGIVVFPAFQALDVFGSYDALNFLALQFPMNLAVIANTLDPVSTRAVPAVMPVPEGQNPMNSNFSQTIIPTHTFDNPPEDLDVLLIPGGVGTWSTTAEFEQTVGFVANTYPHLQYLITVCTGASIAARAGVLDGRNATTNKASFAWVASWGPKVNWITHARWVVDGNIYSTSGVSAGIDGTLAFIADVYGENATEIVVNQMEYERVTNSSYDPFADIYGL
ncbi:ThiJ/PfpI family protein, partial [Cylindrobasidium torrendii FP15055 ss-10]